MIRRFFPNPLRHFVLLVLLLATNAAPAQSIPTAGTIAELRAHLEAHVTDPRFAHALWGLRIESLDTGATVFEHHPDRLMSPASNSKLYAGALALEQLGGEHRIQTTVFASAHPDRHGKVKGDLILYGRGDPSWNLAAGQTNFWRVFDPFIAVLTNAGVRRITGDLIADATFFVGPPSGAGWTVDDLENSEGAELSALTLLDNMTAVRATPGQRPGQPAALTLVDPHTGLKLFNHVTTTANGGGLYLDARRVFGETNLHVFGEVALDTNGVTEVPVPRPAQWFASALQEALHHHGIRVDGRARSLRWPDTTAVTTNCVQLGTITSPPMRSLVRAFMKPSQNLETDLVFNHAGELTRTASTPKWRTSERLAVSALDDFFATNQIPATGLHFEEGSGLSRNNLTSARLTVDLLKVMARHRQADAFADSLPVAGVDGTLRRRMKGTPAEGNVRAKTGTLRWVNALSGYVTTAAGERLVFSLYLNRKVPEAGRSNTKELDAIAVMLAQCTGRTSTAATNPNTP